MDYKWLYIPYSSRKEETSLPAKISSRTVPCQNFQYCDIVAAASDFRPSGHILSLGFLW